MSVEVDKKAVEQFARDIVRTNQMLLGRLAERGHQLLRGEVPEVTGNLKQGVAPPDVEFPIATLTVSARSARNGARQATVYGKDGEEKKKVTLRPQKPYNYAEVVAKGFPKIEPKKARVLLIPVANAPRGESYLIADGKVYVFRRSATIKANPYDERAAARLDTEAVGIAEATLREIFT